MASTGLYSRSCDRDPPSPRRPAGPVLASRARVVRGELRGTDRCPGPRLGRDRRRPEHPHPCPDRVGQDAGRVPVGARSSRNAPDPGTDPCPAGNGPGPLRLAAQGAHVRRRAQPPGAADRHRARRPAAGSADADHHRRQPDRRHAVGGSPRDRPPAPRHPHHDPGIAVSHAHEPGPRGPPRRRARHRRRGPRDRGHEAWRPPRPEPGTTRAPPRRRRAPAPANRAVGDPAPAGRDRRLPRRRRAESGRRRSSMRARASHSTSRSSSRSTI